MDGTLSIRDRRVGRLQGGAIRGILALPPRVLRLFAGSPLQLDGQELDVTVQLMLRLMALQNPPQLDELSVADARRRVALDVLSVAGRAPGDVVVHSVSVPGPEGPLDARLFVPPAPSNIRFTLLPFASHFA